MRKMRLLDLFCGAGGAATGYSRAGFDVVGVDHLPQKHYPFEFYQADALEFCHEHGHQFDAIHASPPCQAYSRLRHLPWLRGKQYPMLIEATREALRATGKAYVIENVPDAPLFGAELCGASVGLPIIRHRRFECNPLILFPPCPGHPVQSPGRAMMASKYLGHGITGVPRRLDRGSYAGHFSGIEAAKAAMGIDWMTRDEMAQAIPPAYTEFIGRQLLAILVRKIDSARRAKEGR